MPPTIPESLSPGGTIFDLSFSSGTYFLIFKQGYTIILRFFLALNITYWLPIMEDGYLILILHSPHEKRDKPFLILPI